LFPAKKSGGTDHAAHGAVAPEIDFLVIYIRNAKMTFVALSIPFQVVMKRRVWFDTYSFPLEMLFKKQGVAQVQPVARAQFDKIPVFFITDYGMNPLILAYLRMIHF
jgi:hypothetical protein